MDTLKTVCPKCKGKGLILKEDNTVELCDCVKYSKEQILIKMNVPKRYWSVETSIENQELLSDSDKNPSYINAFINAMDYVADFKDKSNEGKGLIFMGPPGVGKTYLAVFLLLYLYEKHKIIGLFYDTRSLVFDLKMLIGKDRAYESEYYNRLLNKVIRAPLLVLDDLGSETLTDYNKDIINYIIAARYNDQKPIVITTNMELDTYQSKFIKDLSNPKKQSFQKILNDIQELEKNKKGISYNLSDVPNEIKTSLNIRLGESIVSRLAEMCKIVFLSGDDRRYRK